MDRPRPELELRQLHSFTVLAEELHFGHAAVRLGIAQPPLSQQIRRLEERVGHPLFERTSRGVVLTAAGRELLPAARQALDRVADGLGAARRAGDGEAGTLRAGLAASLALTVLPQVITAFRARHPGVHLEIHELTTTEQVRALHGEVIDVGLLREAGERPGLEIEPLFAEEVVAVLPEDHPLAARRRVPLAGLAADPFVLLPREHGPELHDRLTGLCRAAGFEPRIGQRAVEWQTVAALVAAGLGVSLAPASVTGIRIAGAVYRSLAGRPAHTTVALAWRRDDPAPLLARFLTVARTHIGKL
ncbi:transcriptional regulator [Microtetraspora sp. NBRC 13810]|uniref:LysR family transcriptional regulator n=1 Tax=Microtetraspora sp. NBRC 13810 TaxID=3030990 RepID=UPI002557BBE5|nr:LysR family transcriptional regulator [Microtetraspora sp. NBRC 13810]GLW09079.1 transcriptional regulator [Microtetraspora sp. NBRC 13810]